MRNGGNGEKKLIVTTSWDDGHPLDLKLAEVLSSYGIKGTFYACPRNRENQTIGKNEIRALQSMGFEIGAHTMTHAVATRVSLREFKGELVDSKKFLEDATGQPITSFCYPKGKFNSKAVEAVRSAGYSIGRTAVSFRSSLQFNPHAMPTSCQIYPHTRIVHLRHGLREMNVKGLLDYAVRYRLSSRLERIVEAMTAGIQERGGIVHLWGHSWEIEKNGLWQLLHNVLTLVSNRPSVKYLTNIETLRAVRP